MLWRLPLEPSSGMRVATSTSPVFPPVASCACRTLGHRMGTAMRLLLLILFLFSAQAFAETDPRLVELEIAYNRLHQEQQSLYQQFQMTQELRRMALQENPAYVPGASGVGMESTPGLDYEENVRRQRERQERLQGYERDIAQTYARYLELGAQKRRLLDQIIGLAQPANR